MIDDLDAAKPWASLRFPKKIPPGTSPSVRRRRAAATCPPISAVARHPNLDSYRSVKTLIVTSSRSAGD